MKYCLFFLPIYIIFQNFRWKQRPKGRRFDVHWKPWFSTLYLRSGDLRCRISVGNNARREHVHRRWTFASRTIDVASTFIGNSVQQNIDSQLFTTWQSLLLTFYYRNHNSLILGSTLKILITNIFKLLLLELKSNSHRNTPYTQRILLQT